MLPYCRTTGSSALTVTGRKTGQVRFMKTEVLSCNRRYGISLLQMRSTLRAAPFTRSSAKRIGRQVEEIDATAEINIKTVTADVGYA